MYKLHLILKYLRKRRIAWVSLIAVTLCTTMVLVVISVMGGWLRMFEESFKGLTGDVIISSQSLSGFPHYQEIIAELQKEKEVEASVPVIETFGLINVNNRKTMGVRVFGFPIEQIGKVNAFPQSLWRQYGMDIEAAQERGAKAAEIEAIRKKVEAATPSFALIPGIDYKQEILRGNPRAKPSFVNEAGNWQGIIVATSVVNIRKDRSGKLINREEYLFRIPVKLTVMGVPLSGELEMQEKAERNYWIVDVSRTKVWQYDMNSVYVPFDVLQRDLGMEEKQAERNGKPFTIPARTRDIHVRLKEPHHSSEALRTQFAERANKVIERVFARNAQEGLVFTGEYPTARTWDELQSTWLGAVKKEKMLVTFLFGMISVVAIFLIFCIFYMIVVEKTRDIGIVKSVGATSSGVAGIFLGYGAAIGIIGAGLGLLFGYLIVHNINAIHDWLGKAFNVTVWNPEVYAFETIPNTMNPPEVAFIVGVAIVSSILGALVPAIRAARLNPVEALRWE